MLNHPNSTKAHSPGSSLLAWCLLLMGLAAFAPCILLPDWRDYQRLTIEEQAERHRFQQLQKIVDHERDTLDAIRNDPAVITRLAKRELGFREAGRRTYEVLVETDYPSGGIPFIPKPVEPPVMLKSISLFLPNLNYDNVFCDPASRNIIMAMSIMLIMVSITLTGRKQSA